MTPILEVQSASVIRSTRSVLSDITISFPADRIVGVIGPNGAGKTTLIQTIGGRLAYSGSIRVAGREVIGDLMRARRAVSIAVEPIGPSIHLTGRRYLEFVAGFEKYAAWTPTQIEIIESLDFAEDLDRPIRAYSHGMRKKLSIAASLNEAASIYIYDEIFNGLDIVALRAMRSFFRSLAARGKLILISSHVLQVLFDWCDEIFLLCDGAIARYWSQEALAEHRGDYRSFETAAIDYYR